MRELIRRTSRREWIDAGLSAVVVVVIIIEAWIILAGFTPAPAA